MTRARPTFSTWRRTVRRPLPRRSFARVPRSEFDRHVTALEEQRDRAIAKARATVDWVTSQLEQRADAYVADAAHMERAVRPDAGMPRSTFTAAQRRAIADELRQIVIDIERPRVNDFYTREKGTP